MANISGVLVHCCFSRIHVVTHDKFAADVREEPSQPQLVVLHLFTLNQSLTACCPSRLQESNGGRGVSETTVGSLFWVNPNNDTNKYTSFHVGVVSVPGSTTGAAVFPFPPSSFPPPPSIIGKQGFMQAGLFDVNPGVCSASRT